jgi:hypothetical protein
MRMSAVAALSVAEKARLLEELLQAHGELEHRHAQGAPEAARRIGIGILRGLYACRDDGRDDTILAYAEDYPQNEAAWVVQRLAKLGVELTPRDLALVPEWDLG